MTPMVAKQRFPLFEAEGFANEIIRLIEPYCERVEIVGSIRRRVARVGDIELLAVPRIEMVEEGLFGDLKPKNTLYEYMKSLRTIGEVEERLDKNGYGAFGERYMRLRWFGVPVDLFCVIPPAEWGLLQVIRTGPADFSHKLVTPTVAGGFMPMGMKVLDGALHDRGRKLETPTEESVFEALGMAWIRPEDRKHYELYRAGDDDRTQEVD